MSVYGYCRVSTLKQVEEGESLTVQERQIRGWCLMNGVDLTDLFIERAVSGSIPIGKRPEGARLMSVLRKGDTIVTARLDRIFRSALDALQTVEHAQKKGIRVVVIDGLGDITVNGMAKAFLTISAAFAELERETIRERVSAVKADQRSRSRYLGGIIPYGFSVEDGELVPVESQQAIIRFAREQRSKDVSLRKIRAAIIERFDVAISIEAISRFTGDEQ